MNSKKNHVTKILNMLKSEYPDSKCTLNFNTPFELLVGTILSAQSTDARVNMILPELLHQFPDPNSMANGDLEDIKEKIKTVGLYNNKAKSIISASKMLITNHHGKVPSDMNLLNKLPGVGRKTANVVLGNAFRIPSGIAVDTHVIRLSQRMGLTLNTSAIKIEKDLLEIVPKKDWIDFTHLFIDHGRKICVKKPQCDQCVVEEFCKKNNL